MVVFFDALVDVDNGTNRLFRLPDVSRRTHGQSTRFASSTTMSLFSALSVARSALFINQLGQQVVGNNIANANTPGYSVRDLHQSTAPSQNYPSYSIGLGVKLAGITRRTDAQLLSQLRNSFSEANGANAQAQALGQIELLLGELGDNDVSSLLSQFFDSLNEVANQPQSEGARQLVVQHAQLLSGRIKDVFEGAQQLRSSINSEIQQDVGIANQLISGIADLNSKIVEAEVGQTGVETNSLRDQRDQLVTQLSEYLDVRVFEQDNGALNVIFQSAPLVSNDRYQLLQLNEESVNGNPTFRVSLEQTGIKITGGSGLIGGHLEARDEVVDSFIEDWNDFAGSFIDGFNRLHSRGQGLNAYSEITGSFSVDFPTVSLLNSGFDFPPESGSFQVLVTDSVTGQTKTHEIDIQLKGLTTDTSLEDLVDSINEIDGLSAEINNNGQLSISSDSSNIEFSFANDSSGALAALGINTFFEGNSAANIGVNSTILNDPTKLASSLGGPGLDTKLIVELARFGEQASDRFGGLSLRGSYESLVSDVALKSNGARSLAEGMASYAASLDQQHQALTGVNLDEEALKMLRYEQAYGAATRYLQTVNEMIDELLQI